MKTYKWATGLTLGLLTLALAMPAHAQLTMTQVGTTITQTYDFSSLADTGSGATDPLVFQAFNSSLGTLTSVELVLDSNVSGTGTVTNTNTSATVTIYDLQINGKYTVGDGINSLTASPSTEAIGTPPITVAASSSYTSSTLSSSDTGGTGTQSADSGSLTGSSTLAFYTGASSASTVTLNLASANSVYDIAGGSGLAPTSSLSSFGSGDVKVIYNYTATPVPEPTTTLAWMLAFGLCVIAGRKVQMRRTVAVVA